MNLPYMIIGLLYFGLWLLAVSTDKGEIIEAMFFIAFNIWIACSILVPKGK